MHGNGVPQCAGQDEFLGPVLPALPEDQGAPVLRHPRSRPSLLQGPNSPPSSRPAAVPMGIPQSENKGLAPHESCCHTRRV